TGSEAGRAHRGGLVVARARLSEASDLHIAVDGDIGLCDTFSVGQRDADDAALHDEGALGRCGTKIPGLDQAWCVGERFTRGNCHYRFPPMLSEKSSALRPADSWT